MTDITVAMLTPWMVKCGLASYSYYLTHALAEVGCESKVVRFSRFGARDETYYSKYTEEVPLDVDVIHIHHEYGLYQAQEPLFYQTLKNRLTIFGLDTPIVTTMHASGNLTVDRVIRHFSNAVIVHNEFGQKQFRLDCNIIPMGVQKVKTAANSDISKRRWGVKGKTVGMFGFISEYKGIETLIDVLSTIPDVKLIIGGGWHLDATTPYMSKIKFYAQQKMPGRVLWLGYISEEDLQHFFGACDVMFYGHHFISESMSLLTAIAYKKAVIASNQPSFKEKEPTILTFKNKEDLRGKINALLNETELRTLMEKKAEEYAEKYSWINVAKEHIKLYEELISGDSNG